VLCCVCCDVAIRSDGPCSDLPLHRLSSLGSASSSPEKEARTEKEEKKMRKEREKEEKKMRKEREKEEKKKREKEQKAARGNVRTDSAKSPPQTRPEAGSIGGGSIVHTDSGDNHDNIKIKRCVFVLCSSLQCAQFCHQAYFLHAVIYLFSCNIIL
jgi:hypothetical protein